jgi:hypothetical protein
MGKGGPRYFSNTEVAIAVERLHPKRASGEHVCAGFPRRPGRTRSLPSPRTASPAPGSIVYTDGDRPYNDLSSELGVTHQWASLTEGG